MDNVQIIKTPWQQAIAARLEKHRVIYQFLRFACIGFLNTALNFLVLNSVSKALHISKGWNLGAVEALAFILTVIQSYLWNRTWTFGSEQTVGLLKNVIRLMLVGSLGVLTIILVLVGSKSNASYWYYLMLLAAYLIFESALWKLFGFHTSDFNHESHSFIIFVTVTLIGLGINYFLVSVISLRLQPTHTDLDKNIAAVIATGVSLFWNFMGYKIVVFKNKV